MGESIAIGSLEFVIENRTVGEDGGPSLQVRATVEGQKVQLLRFDMFHKQPHYHYAPHGLDLRYTLDPLTVDDGIGWVTGLLGRKLPQLITKAGYEGLLESVDQGAVAAALPGIERRWRALGPEAPRPAGQGARH
jgi:hypothetical protein